MAQTSRVKCSAPRRWTAPKSLISYVRTRVGSQNCKRVIFRASEAGALLRFATPFYESKEFSWRTEKGERKGYPTHRDDVFSRRDQKKGLILVRGYNTEKYPSPFREGFLPMWIDHDPRWNNLSLPLMQGSIAPS